MIGFNVSWPTVIIMSIIWIWLFYIYTIVHKRTTGGFVDRFLAGKYNEMLLTFGKKLLQQNPDIFWNLVKHIFMQEVKPGQYRLNDQSRLLFIQMINEGLAYMDHSVQGQYGRMVQDGELPNLSELSEVSPGIVNKGRKLMGKWGPLAMKGLKVMDDLSSLKDQFHKIKEPKE